MNKYPVTTKVKELIHDEVGMGTYGLVELEVKALESLLSKRDLQIKYWERKGNDLREWKEGRMIFPADWWTKFLNRLPKKEKHHDR